MVAGLQSGHSFFPAVAKLRTTQIADRLEQLGGTVPVRLDAMQRDGLVLRKKDETDRGVSKVYLTDRGRLLKTSLEPAAAALIREMIATLAPEESQSLSMQIAHLRKTVSREP